MRMITFMGQLTLDLWFSKNDIEPMVMQNGGPPLHLQVSSKVNERLALDVGSTCNSTHTALQRVAAWVISNKFRSILTKFYSMNARFYF